MKANADSKTYRAVVVRDVRTEHRAVLFAVGQPAHRCRPRPCSNSCGQAVGRRRFQEGQTHGADAFCGGAIVPELRREPPTPAEVEQLQERAAKLKNVGRPIRQKSKPHKPSSRPNRSASGNSTTCSKAFSVGVNKLSRTNARQKTCCAGPRPAKCPTLKSGGRWILVK